MKMKTTAQLSLLLTGLCLMGGATGCGNDRGTSMADYQVTCRLDGTAPHDSATLLVLEEDYNKLRVCGTARAANGTFSFTGQTDRPRVALLRWDNDSTTPFHFVLEPGHIDITIATGSWNITGSRMNTDYQHFVNQRNSIMKTRADVWQEYLQHAADHSLKREDERRLVARDSVLNDSLQCLTVDRINRGDVVGRIVRERFARQLDQEHMRMLK